MRLPFFSSKAADAAPAGRSAPGADDDPQALRVRARRRLVGALVLLVVGVVVFPLIFETQPRPLPGNTPILLPEGAPARVAGTVGGAALPASAGRPVLPADAGTEGPAAPASAAAAPALAPSQVSPPAAARAASVAAPASAAVARAEPKPATKPTTKPEPAAKPEPKTDAKPAPEVGAAGRFVVQVGAYNDLDRLKAARARLEKLGYKSYTQDVESSTGRRTRVRVGPFATRQEAEAVAAKVKAAGLQAAILSL